MNKVKAYVPLRKAEADGIQALAKALAGPGGLTMVKLEYARRLATIPLMGQPFTLDSDTKRFEHLRAPAAEGRNPTR